MKRALVFRYHRDEAVCRNRLELLHQLNPGLAIHGICGGEVPFDLPHLASNWLAPPWQDLALEMAKRRPDLARMVLH